MTPDQKAASEDAIEAAFEAYRQTPEYEREKSWALYGAETDGALQNVFSAGARAATSISGSSHVGEHGLEDVERAAREIERAWDEQQDLPPIEFLPAEREALARAALSVIRPASDELAAAREEIETLRTRANAMARAAFEVCNQADPGTPYPGKDGPIPQDLIVHWAVEELSKASNAYYESLSPEQREVALRPEIDERRIARDGETE